MGSKSALFFFVLLLEDVSCGRARSAIKRARVAVRYIPGSAFSNSIAGVVVLSRNRCEWVVICLPLVVEPDEFSAWSQPQLLVSRWYYSMVCHSTMFIQHELSTSMTSNKHPLKQGNGSKGNPPKGNPTQYWYHIVAHATIEVYRFLAEIISE